VVEAPVTDEDVPRFWERLGLPGLIDVHVHFMPRNVMDKVWAYFDTAGPLTGTVWPIAYRLEEEERLAHLRAMGVQAFPSLVYPHRPDMAEWLNAWATDFAARTPECLTTATFYPEESAARYVEQALDRGTRLFKAHVQVGGYDPRDALLRPVWGLLEEAGVPVVVHAGNGPAPGAFTGPGPFGEVLAAFPRLAAIVAHMGLPDYGEFADFAQRYPNVRLDTTMAFVDFWGRSSYDGMLERLPALQHKILFGSDFPNIPYPYAHQIEALVRLGVGDEWLRDVCWRNAATLFEI
jgi:predicted TIM-barrel fold metal-dependent hydrolase